MRLHDIAAMETPPLHELLGKTWRHVTLTLFELVDFHGESLQMDGPWSAIKTSELQKLEKRLLKHQRKAQEGSSSSGHSTTSSSEGKDMRDKRSKRRKKKKKAKKEKKV